ncbi:MAG TPA: hypothetical protein VGP72_15505 [Planctomycetota bacterium]|jgi:drug/metabolite transporter (DMT)-like permease
MYADMMLTLLLLSSMCAVGMGVVATQYLDDVEVPEAAYMKYGVCIQIWGFIALALAYLISKNDVYLHFLITMTLAGAAIYCLGALTVVKAMRRARVAFASLALAIEACLVVFAIATTFMLT